MSKVLVIPDVHLKPDMFDKADKIISSGMADNAIQLGDMLDDFGEEYNISLYEKTLHRAIKFYKDHPGSLWCCGNHDFGYLYAYYGPRESGHSVMAGPFVRPLLEKLPLQNMHIVDGVIFTHAGLTQTWMDYMSSQYMKHDFPDTEEKILRLVNELSRPDDMWKENSLIWARPQVDKYEMWPAKLQVVGHTPMKTPTEKGGVLSTDTFSTYSNGAPYGDRNFVIIDTETGKWKKIKEDNEDEEENEN